MQNSNNINQPGFIDNSRIGNTDFPQIYKDLLTNLNLRQNMPNVNPYGSGAQDSNSIAGMRVTEGPTGYAAPIGQYGMGNIDLYNRPVIKNPDGSISTVRSMSFNDGKNEVLIPTVSPAGVMTPQEAINRYRQTGEYLGKFNTPEQANEYAQRLHEEQANLYNNGTPTGFAAPVQYNQMTPIQQGMQYNTASFDNPNLVNSGMTPADIDKLRVMQGREPMPLEMRERLINAMRNRGYQY